jgi:multicomponent K+:H+ antiporter subunit E
MRRVMPSPALSLALFLLWVLLMQSSSAGVLMLGVGLSLFWPIATRRLRNDPAQIRRPRAIATLVGRVVADMLRSNVRVAWAILTRPSDGLRSRFVTIPLDLHDPNALAALAMIVTFTPGTAWARLSADNRVLLLHVLDVDGDDAEEVAYIKRRYERPLREIFE